MDSTKILTRSEIALVVDELRRKRRRINTRQNSVIFRLSCCCGLRVSEIAGLNIANVKCEGKRPHIYVPKEIAKRNKPRKVPLWWDGSTLAELAAWKAERLNLGGKSDSSFVCAQSKAVQGKRLSIRNVQFRWQAAIKVLGKERADNLSIHSGRHSFCSHAIAGGRTVVEVQNAAGHAGLNTLTIYAHLVEDDDEAVGNLFDFAAK